MKKLVEYGGNGYNGEQEHWTYEIKYGEGEGKSKTIKGLSKAREFYDSLQVEKALWNPRTMELLEAHIYGDDDIDDDDLPF